MEKNCIIVASGKGTRFGGDVPKQYTIINNKPVWYYSVNAFIKHCSQVVVVVHEDYLEEVTRKSGDYFGTDADKIIVVAGGNERYDSVLNGLNAIENEDSLVAVHDSVRALISEDVIDGSFEMAEKNGNAIVYAPVVDTIKYNDNGNYSIVDRNKLLAIQTPQIASKKMLAEFITRGIEDGFKGTDDSSFLEYYGEQLSYYEGKKSNIKLTTKEDLDYFIFYIEKYLS